MPYPCQPSPRTGDVDLSMPTLAARLYLPATRVRESSTQSSVEIKERPTYPCAVVELHVVCVSVDISRNFGMLAYINIYSAYFIAYILHID